MKRLKWTEHEASDATMLMRAACVSVDRKGGVWLYVHRDLSKPAQAWRFDCEVDCIIEPDQDYADEATARRRSLEHALKWARALVTKLEAVTT